MSEPIEVIATSWYDAEFAALAPEHRTRIEKRLDTFRRKGWREAMTDHSVVHLRDGIFELRILGRGAAFRVLFFVAPGRSPHLVVLTTAAAKSVLKKRQRLDAEIERARHRRALWLEQQILGSHDGRR